MTLIERGVSPNDIVVYEDTFKGINSCLNRGVIVVKSLEELNGMKFDVVIGNPPYQKSDHKAKTSSLWKIFLNKANELCDGVISLIIPASFCSPTKLFSEYKNRLSVLDFTAKDYFKGVGSSFVRIRLEPNNQQLCRVITSSGEYQLDLNNWDCVPSTLNDELMNLIDNHFDMDSDDKKWKLSCEYHTQQDKWKVSYEYDQRKECIVPDGSIKILHSTKVLWANKDHPNNHLIRVFCTITNGTKFSICEPGTGLSQNNIWTTCETMEQAEQLRDGLNRPDIQKLLKAFQFSNMNYYQIINKLRLGVL
jgi:hypothetical protein